MGFLPIVSALVLLALLAPFPVAGQALTTQAELLLRQGMELGKRGNLRQALDRLALAKALYRQAGDRRNEAVTLSYLGTVYFALGEHLHALGIYETALATLHGMGDRGAEATILHSIGRVYARQGDTTRALTYFQRSLKLQRALGNRDGEGAVLGDISSTYRDRDDPAQALDYDQQALQRQLGKPGPRRPNWTDKASLSFVQAAGNAQAQSLGFANEYTYNWSDSTSLAVNAGAVRASSTSTSYSASGSSTSAFTLTRLRANQVNTEDYLANARFAQDLAGSLLWFTGAGWERNLPAGIGNRWVANAGMGYWWTRSESRSFRSDLGLGYTRARPVAMAPGFQAEFSTLNATLNFEQKFGETTTLTSNLNWTESLPDPGNILALWRTDLTTGLYRHLALKVGLALTCNSRPASRAVDIVQTGSNPPVILGQTFVELKKLDTILSASLVLAF